MKQTTLTGFEKYGKTTRRAQFLADMQLIAMGGTGGGSRTGLSED